jgi:hypothetical protein
MYPHLNVKQLLIIIIISSGVPTSAQNFSKIIRGTVTDKDSKMSLPGATVYLADLNPVKGTTTDEKGNFRLEGVETGRHKICVSYVGYEPVCLENINLTSGKELVLDIEMEGSVTNMNEVVVKAREDKGNAINTMTTVSSRTFSIEETQRYAGARNDVARMASNYAGVSAGNDATNEIVIRGNSPNGLLWQLEGVEIPNPNHYGSMGTTGGPVSMLNNNALDNSDFLTSAFPAQYGNAVSGVFDIRMREGNHEKHEFLGQVGFNGFELGAEGPVSKKNNSSYLINYRYSTLAFTHLIGISYGTGTAVPDFQDLSFKIVSNLGRGKVSLFGMGGLSSIEFMGSKADSADMESFYSDANLDIYNSNKQGVIGLNYIHFIGSKSYAELILSADGLQNENKIDTVYRNPLSTSLYDLSNYHSQDYAAKLIFNSKLNNMINLRLGGELRRIDFSLRDSSYMSEYNSFFNVYNDKGSTILMRAYAEGTIKLTDDFSINAGLHVINLALNHEVNVEPRIAFKYKPFQNHTFSIGYGKHSKMLPMWVYYRRVDLNSEDYDQPNKNLGMVKADHYVVSWDWQVTALSRVKVEGYYQHLYNAAVEVNPSSFSLLNSSSYQFNIADTLKNGGTGDNKGIELTVEQFINKGFYFLGTASLFDSKYKGSDGILRSTVFDGGYVFNVLVGKEFKLNSKNALKKKYITADVKITGAGGQRYTPIDVEQSKIKNETVYDDKNAFSESFSDYFRMDVRIAYRKDKPKYSQEIAIDVQNITNKSNPLYMTYDVKTGETKTMYQLKLTPMMQYKITF